VRPGLKSAWEALPMPVRNVVAMTIDRAQGGTIDAPPTVPATAPVRLFIGPTNWGGQATRWARAVERNSQVVARNMISAEINGFGYDVDYAVRWRVMTHSRSWQRSMLAALARDYTHVLIEAEMPPLGGMFGGDVRRQIAALRAEGLIVGMVAHGTDVRLPSRHRDLEPWSPFADDDWVPVALFEKAVAENLSILADAAAPTFVSTPGLLIDVPYAHLLPVVIDPALWPAITPALERRRLRVAHVPSNPIPKGTLQIAPVLRRLHEEGVIEYQEIIGRTQAEMPGIFGTADIVLDQFRVGDYGVGACESMSSGRLVVSHVSEQARNVVRHESGLSLPIVEATIDDLESVLRDVHARRDHYRAIAAEGPPFVRALHDGAHSRSILERQFLFGAIL
jgi:hypothetical protein